MKKIIALLIFLNSFYSSAQISFDTSIYHKDFIKLKNGETYLDNINVESGGVFRNDKFFANGKEIKDKYIFGLTNYVEYCKFNGDFYGRYHGSFVNFRHREKRINFFGPVNIRGSHLYSYSRDLNGMKKLCTRNLHHDLIDDPEAFRLINKANKSRIISWASFGEAVAFTLPLYFVNGNREGIALLGVAAIGGVLNGIIFQIIRKKQTQHALIAYSPTLPKYQRKFFTLRQRKPFEEGGFLRRLFTSSFHN